MKKFGLALSGGGARAIIHAGFLQALNESGLHPEIISGASMGAIIGALYADGFPPDEMLKVLIKPEISRLPAWIGRKGGIGSLMVLREHLDGILQAKSFEELKIPLIISVTNLNKGENELISSGSLIDWVVASASIPIVFQPVKINDHYYVDGGLTNNLPILCLKDSNLKVIAVESNHLEKVDTAFTSIKTVWERTLFLAVQNTLYGQIAGCDLFIDSPEVRKFGIFDFQHASHIYAIGYKIGKKNMDTIVQLLSD